MMSDKAPDAYRTISEVAEDLDLPQHVLRFWETRFSQIKPLKRGGGRRYYRPDDLALLRGIRELLYRQGYTIKGVQRILRDQGVKTVQSVGRGEGTIAPAPEERAAPAESHPPPQAPNFQAQDFHASDFAPPRPERENGAAAIAAAPAVAPAYHAAAAGPVRTLEENQRLRLRTALFELGECRRLLDMTKTAEDSNDPGS